MPQKFDDMDKPLPLTHPVHDRPVHPIDPTKLAVDEIVTVSIRGKIRMVNPDGTMLIEDLIHGGVYSIPIMAENTMSADQWSEEKTISRTTMEQILLSVRDQPLTVAYVKKDGQERLLRGYRDVDHPNQKLGRVLGVDLALPKEDRLRLIDLQSLVWLVTGCVRYILHR